MDSIENLLLNDMFITLLSKMYPRLDINMTDLGCESNKQIIQELRQGVKSLGVSGKGNKGFELAGPLIHNYGSMKQMGKLHDVVKGRAPLSPSLTEVMNKRHSEKLEPKR